MATKSMTNRW